MSPGVTVRVPSVGPVASTVRGTGAPVPVPPEFVARTLIVNDPVNPAGLPVQVYGDDAPLTTPATQVEPLVVYSQPERTTVDVTEAVITGEAVVKLPDVGVTVTVPIVGAATAAIGFELQWHFHNAHSPPTYGPGFRDAGCKLGPESCCQA